MRFIRYLGISAFAVIMAFMVLTATTVHAESGCFDADRPISAGTNFNLGYQCEVSGDVEIMTAGGVYQRLYEDDDASTALLVRCTDTNGCSARTNPYGGAYVSARDTVTMVVDTFKYVPNLRYMDAKCFPVGCGVTRYFPQLSPPYYTSTTLSPVAPPAVTYMRMYFTAGMPVMGGWIYINGSYAGYSCYVPSAWGSGYVDGGQTNPQFTQGASVALCSGGSTVPNPVPVVNPPFPWPFPWPYPLVSPTGGITADVCAQWGCKTFWWNDMVVGGVIYLNDGSVFRDCYVSNYHQPGTQVGGVFPLNPSSNYGLPQCDQAHRIR